MKLSEDQNSVLARYMDGPALLERALDGLREADLDICPSQGSWTIRQTQPYVWQNILACLHNFGLDYNK